VVGLLSNVRQISVSAGRLPLHRPLRFVTTVVFLAVFAAKAIAADAQSPLVLNSKRVHLGVAGKPEWEEFAGRAPDGQRLDLRFNSRTNEREATLFIRQDEVRQDWGVELNGKRLGKLFLMEADLVHALTVPAGALRDGTNVLSIIPPKENDDIVLHGISLDQRPPAEALPEAVLDLSVADAANHRGIPCRLTIVTADGALAALRAITNEPPGAPFVAARPGVVYTGTGSARVGLPAGVYTVYASRGFEWSVATQQVRLSAGQRRELSFELRREVSTPGLIACDTHVHTFTHSRHGDATMEERMLTLAGEGIELPIATDHNLHIDYSETAGRMGVASYFTPVTGNEVTTPAGHFNIFPVEPSARAPDFRITDWPTLMKSMRGTPGVQVIVLNHPRNVHQNFQPFAATNFNPVTGTNKRGPAFTFDAMEVLNSSAQQSDYMLVYKDWFALWNHGYRITGVGSSDGHDVSRYIIGQGRTYIACPDTDARQIDVPLACSNLLAGQTLVSMGLLAQMTVDSRFKVGDLATNLGPQVRVSVQVLGPSWVNATNVCLFANGVKIQEETLPFDGQGGALAPGEKARIEWLIPKPRHDVYLVAIATGPGVTAPFWAIPRPYQPTSPRWEGRVIGSTNPILLDADGDGLFTAARGYAKQIVARHGANPKALQAALADYDDVVAAQVAELSDREQSRAEGR